mgnify:CR=1 FL=1
MISLLRKRMRGDKGFTLIELLVVIIIIAILAAIAIPTFLGQRQKAQDSAAKSLCRNAMTAIESAYVDTRNFADITEDLLLEIEPSIDFVVGTENAATAPTAEAADDEVDFLPSGASDAPVDAYQVGCVSLSDKTFGVFVNKTAADIGTYEPGNTFFIGEVGTAGTPDDW